MTDDLDEPTQMDCDRCGEPMEQVHPDDIDPDYIPEEIKWVDVVDAHYCEYCNVVIYSVHNCPDCNKH